MNENYREMYNEYLRKNKEDKKLSFIEFVKYDMQTKKKIRRLENEVMNWRLI